MKIIQAVRGFKDILPEETPLWRELEERVKDARHQEHVSHGYCVLGMPMLCRRSSTLRRSETKG